MCRLAAQFPRERVDDTVAHITVTTPFLPEDQVTSEVLGTLTELVLGVGAFSCVLASCEDFDSGWYYLAPRDPVPFLTLAALIAATFPMAASHDPAHAEIVPHMSVGVERDASLRNQLMWSTTAHLPLHASVDEIMLVRSGPQDWVRLASFALSVRSSR